MVRYGYLSTPFGINVCYAVCLLKHPVKERNELSEWAFYSDETCQEEKRTCNKVHHFKALNFQEAYVTISPSKIKDGAIMPELTYSKVDGYHISDLTLPENN
jgi:hypothetical protein